MDNISENSADRTPVRNRGEPSFFRHRHRRAGSPAPVGNTTCLEDSLDLPRSHRLRSRLRAAPDATPLIPLASHAGSLPPSPPSFPLLQNTDDDDDTTSLPAKAHDELDEAPTTAGQLTEAGLTPLPTVSTHNMARLSAGMPRPLTDDVTVEMASAGTVVAVRPPEPLPHGTAFRSIADVVSHIAALAALAAGAERPPSRPPSSLLSSPDLSPDNWRLRVPSPATTHFVPLRVRHVDAAAWLDEVSLGSRSGALTTWSTQSSPLASVSLEASLISPMLYSIDSLPSLDSRASPELPTPSAHSTTRSPLDTTLPASLPRRGHAATISIGSPAALWDNDSLDALDTLGAVAGLHAGRTHSPPQAAATGAVDRYVMHDRSYSPRARAPIAALSPRPTATVPQWDDGPAPMRRLSRRPLPASSGLPPHLLPLSLTTLSDEEAARARVATHRADTSLDEHELAQLVHSSTETALQGVVLRRDSPLRLTPLPFSSADSHAPLWRTPEAAATRPPARLDARQAQSPTSDLAHTRTYRG